MFKLMFVKLTLFVLLTRASTECNSEITKSKRDQLLTTAWPPCNEDQLVSFLADIQAINPESIVQLSTEQDLDALCKKVTKNLDHMNRYLKTCTIENEEDLYLKLIKGVESLHGKICKENAYKKEFDSHYGCYHKLRTDFQDCIGPADWNEHYDPTNVCNAYKDICDCYYIKTAKICGQPAAQIMKQLVEAVIDSILIVKCENVKSDPTMQGLGNSSNIKKPSATTILIFIQIIYYTNCIFF